MKRQKQEGMALVVTLIMLAVILVITVAFLAVARRDRASVTQAANMTDTEFMADAGRERAVADLAISMMTQTNIGLMISTNADIDTNTWTALTVDPRPPVFIRTAQGMDFRCYLDLDRNGVFNQTGFFDSNGNPVAPTDPNVMGFFTGDPQWIGVLERPGLPHARDNRFMGRYAYIVLSVGKALDLNYIHNQALSGSGYRFYRNQGFGTYEINLGAFLADLNPRVWGLDPAGRYDFVFPGPMSYGFAFEDAMALVRFRYNGDYPASARVDNVFNVQATNFMADNIDGCAHDFGTMIDNVNSPWPGANSLRHFYSVHDLYNPTTSRSFTNFTSRLTNAVAQVDPFERSTYYRMLEQLTTESSPEKQDKIHINYSNVWNGVVLPNAATNFTPWEPTNFFMSATERMLGEELTNFSWRAKPNRPSSGIPVVLRGSTVDTNTGRPWYSARIHQRLKQAANIHDATTESDYPTVFRPQFRVDGSDIYIAGYVQESNTTFVARPWRSLTDPNDLPNPDDNVYGIPVIVGAKKGWPNFNKFAVQSMAQFGRKLEFVKNNPSDRFPSQTNQMFMVGISNSYGLQMWNSYSNDTTVPLGVWIKCQSTTLLTNDLPNYTHPPTVYDTNFTTWLSFKGYQRDFPSVGSFQAPLFTNQAIVSNSVFYTSPTPHFEGVGPLNRFESDTAVYRVNWRLTNTTRIALCMTAEDSAGNKRLVDVVSLDNINTDFPISEELNKPMPSGSSIEVQGLWDTNAFGVVTRGVNNQIMVSAKKGLSTDAEWRSYSENPLSGVDRLAAIDNFAVFLGLPAQTYSTNSLTSYYSNRFMSPFNPQRKMVQTTSWEVNDPLVHYTTNDLVRVTQPVQTVVVQPAFTNLWQLNSAYKPWGGNPKKDAPNDPTAWNESVRDSGVKSSDDWEFPKQKFANIGWLGRVHRGTPWQTIYLKSRIPDASQWMQPNGPATTIETHPTNDWSLVDMFTVAQHPNATRGQLSINQTNVPAWSAVLSGVEVTTLRQAGGGGIVRGQTNVVPGALESPVTQIVEGINRERNKLGGQFRKLSDVLRVPELTVRSPYLQTNYIPQAVESVKHFYLKDEDYERIPEQILSLLRLGEERYVIYAWGQSLKPAPNSVVTSGNNFGLCNNYQITGEVATRTVVRFEFPNTNTVSDAILLDYSRPQAIIESFNILPPE